MDNSKNITIKNLLNNIKSNQKIIQKKVLVKNNYKDLLI